MRMRIYVGPAFVSENAEAVRVAGGKVLVEGTEHIHLEFKDTQHAEATGRELITNGFSSLGCTVVELALEERYANE